MNKEKIAISISIKSLFVNIFLVIFKFTAGFLSKSNAMISDAIHSLSDVVTTVIVMVGVKLSNKESDSKHPYGHERFESIAAIILAGILFVTGIGIGMNGIKQLIAKNTNIVAEYSLLAIIAAVTSIVMQEVMYWYTIKGAKKINSDVLKADAWHHRSDALSSIGSLIGLIGVHIGFPMLDSIASLVICLFILKAAISIFIDGSNKLIDKSCDKETVKKIKSLILEHSEVKNIDNIKTRMFASRVYIDIEIALDQNLSLYDAHKISENIHDNIEEKFPEVKHCMIHTNPYDSN